MCGIAGLVLPKTETNELSVRAKAALKALHHRGPDDEGLFVSSEMNAALVHARLSIIDLSPAGHQPMVTPDGRFAIVFNGEIYNYVELREELERRGEIFFSKSDTEVILRFYALDGPSFLNKLRGMFAFGILDSANQSIFLARDTLGIKPLYLCSSNGNFAFASEIRTILATGIVEKQLSELGVLDFLANGSVSEPHTIVQGICCLEAGHCLFYNKNESKTWSFIEKESKNEISTDKNDLSNALTDTIKSHFVSDVPVGIMLSGGIDSSAVLALARRHTSGELKTFSLSFPQEYCNEGGLAKKTAEAFATEHTEWCLTGDEAKKLLPLFFAAMDQPSIDGLNSFAISKVVAENGVKVVLSGLGGDELFGGYPSFRTIPNLKQAHSLLRIFLGAGPIALDLTGRILKDSRFLRLSQFFSTPYSTKQAFKAIRSIFTLREIAEIWPQYALQCTLEENDNFNHHGLQEKSLLSSIAELEIANYMRNQLLRDTDVFSMKWGIEARVPFVDTALYNTVRRLPDNLRFQPGKQCLVDAVGNIPPWLLGLPKRGFMLPYSEWFATTWGDFLKKSPVPNCVLIDTWYRRWALVVLQEWCEINGFSFPSPVQ